MTIIVLPDVIVPKSVIVAGVSGVNSRQNQRSRNQGGYASANVIRDVTLRAWQIGTGPMKLSAAEQVFALFEVTDAGAYGMLLEDPIDSMITPANGALMGYMLGVESGVVGFGNGGPLYGLRKVYAALGSTQKRARAITRPNSTPTITRGGSPVTVGVAPGNISLSAAPVFVTFVPDATRTVTAIAAGATTQVTLSSAIGLAIGQKLWLQGISGIDQGVVNNQAHTITNISGGGLNTYTLSTNTAGKTIAAAGEGRKYPQADEALVCTCSFYVPVQFRDDTLDWDLVIAGNVSRREVQIPQTFLDEIREA